jgi:hypothetical protein
MASTSSKDGHVDYRTRMLRRGPGHPGTIEQASNPRQALVRLLPYLGPYRLTLALVLFLVLISTALGLAGPYLLGRAIDGYIATGDAAGLATIATWMLAVYLAGNLADVNRRLAGRNRLPESAAEFPPRPVWPHPDAAPALLR